MTENASLTTISIALMLADEAMGHKPLIINGSPDFRKKVLEIAVHANLPISFLDNLLQNEFEEQKEDEENERNIFVANGGKIISKRPNIKPAVAPTHAKRVEDATKEGFRLPTLSQCSLVYSKSRGTDVFLQADEFNGMDELTREYDKRVRWDFSGERKRLAKLTAQKILENVTEALEEESAVSHIEYINRERAFAHRSGCIFHSHHLPKWAQDDPKNFFQAAEEYEAIGNRRYREIEFALPNELKTVEHYRQIIDAFIEKHLSNHYYAYAIHNKIGVMSDGQHHPHVHIMFSERVIDYVEQKQEREAKSFFLYPAHKKKDGSQPSFEEKWKRGAPKARKWVDKNFLAELRADFAEIQNEVLSRNNFSIRVDHRTLKAQKEEAERVVNVGGVKNLINLCTACNLQFIQISTMSTVRNGIKGEVDESTIPNETTLYFRQMLTNKYVHSKFLAERAILDAVANDGLNAKIMRVGTLSARYSDGEFQINADTNSSMGRLKIFAILGCCPFAQMDNLIEFSPIDEVAKTILILSETPKECVIFQPINHHNMSIGDVVRSMKSCGIEINFVEQEDFQAAWQAAEEDPDKAKILTRGCW